MQNRKKPVRLTVTERVTSARVELRVTEHQDQGGHQAAIAHLRSLVEGLATRECEQELVDHREALARMLVVIEEAERPDPVRSSEGSRATWHELNDQVRVGAAFIATLQAALAAARVVIIDLDKRAAAQAATIASRDRRAARETSWRPSADRARDRRPD